MRQDIYVVSHGNGWMVRCDHCDSAVLSTQSEAIKIAKEHVASLPVGTLSQIRIQNANGQFRAEWTYENDPFPPRG